jgi:hypothetical protein
MSTPLRVGVIGAGIMGADHVKTLHRYVSGATVTVVADIDLKRALAVATGVPGARATSDPCELITAPDVDAVVIASRAAPLRRQRAGRRLTAHRYRAAHRPRCPLLRGSGNGAPHRRG